MKINYKPKADVSDGITGKSILGKGMADGRTDTERKLYKSSKIDGSGHGSGKSEPNRYVYATGHADNIINT